VTLGFDGAGQLEVAASTDAQPLQPGGCLEATVPGKAALDSIVEGGHSAKVSVSGNACARSYLLSTTAPLRDSLPANPRAIVEQPGAPFVRSGNPMFDALYALALAEAQENAVDAIQDGAFNNGAPIPCPKGGCFETGRLWRYVWTRDAAYATHLALGLLDPVRARNTLEFKLSGRRAGAGAAGADDVQVVQDTGTGGSYPVSTDRVVWALGARELLATLSGAERMAFRDKAYTALRHTIEHDRQVVYDAEAGLYRGEQSFLDWREQSYPAWMASDVVHIGLGHALSTNVLHLAALDLVATLAAEKGEPDAAKTYAGWRDALRTAIDQRFWLDDEQQFASFRTTTLDPSPVRRFDALGVAMAVLMSAGPAEHLIAAMAHYPVLPKGVPVLWPQQKETPIYHNRAMWPFVTAYFAKAAAQVGNSAALDHAVDSLMRGAALNLSNMENFEVVSGAAYLDDGSYSGPVVNSHRQLWSVAGYLALVQDVLFGRRFTTDGQLTLAPAVTRRLRRTVWANADRVVLNDLRWRGKKLSIALKLPAANDAEGMLAVGKVTLNGAPHAATFSDGELLPDNVVEVELTEVGALPPGELRLVDATDDYKNLFGPRTPTITGLTPTAGGLKVAWDANGEAASEVDFAVYRDGVRVAEHLSGSSTGWNDTATVPGVSHCYAIEATFVGSNNHGQHSAPMCDWGPELSRITAASAPAFGAKGGKLVLNHGKHHYEDWGAPADTLTAELVPASTGRYLVQVDAGNGAGPIHTGVTCGVKAVEVWSGSTLVGAGTLVMPHQGTWASWRGSSFVPVKLVGGQPYQIVVKQQSASVNMSFFAHFALYTGGLGGKDGAFGKVNISEIKLLGLGP
jgi:hypothetical protein